jgi:hypothetical protein
MSIYDSGWYREQAAIAKRQNLDHIAKYDRSFNGVMSRGKLDQPRDDDAGTEKRVEHHASTVADLLVEAGSHPDRSAALDYLMHSSRGAALLHRMSKAARTEKETSMTSHTELVRDVVKQYGLIAFCKSMVQDQKSYGLDEHQFTRLATEHAQRVYPNDRPDTAFSKLYQSEESVRRACQIAKSMPFQVSLEPLMVGGDAAQAVNDPSEAIAQLRQLGARKWPTATEAQQFANAFTDPVNRELASKAHVRPSANSVYEFPR